MQGAGLLSEARKEESRALSLSVADNVTLSKLKGFGPLGLVLPGRQDKATRRWLERLDIRCRGPRQSVSSLSGGHPPSHLIQGQDGLATPCVPLASCQRKGTRARCPRHIDSPKPC